jgi:proteasome lid subunit RPN8/RPN11
MELYALILFAEMATLAVILMLIAMIFYLAKLAFLGCEKPAKQEERNEKLLIPSLILRRAYDYLAEYGKQGKEWEVALGCQNLDGNKIVTDVYKLKCKDSSALSAEPDYGDLSEIQDFYENCEAKIVAIVHIHPWTGRSVSPSSIDWRTQKAWEELYKGEFIGIVFTNNGVFRIFYTKNCALKPIVVGGGIEKMGEDLYAIKN